ncbi:RimK family alpha-L-glutamate ligase [Pedobacter sp. SYP-B3415]|uniref:ATP-grasp domain-containing protein n=1 Tax=Pedobacter sp. SYP-B3415 TaxID=2496641 RepID=UPI00101B9276|nr:hypothetical protein [Pedobacter sp. SYP-B3415]
MIKILKRCWRIAAIIRLIDWRGFFKHHHTDARILLWIPKMSLKYFGSDALIWDMATLAALIRQKKPFKIVTGRKIGRYHRKKIFFSLSLTYNIYGFANHTAVLEHIATQLERQGNRIFPSKHELSFWENKARMHEAFRAAGVHEPLSQICTNPVALLADHPPFPFLIKSEHSCASQGLYKIESTEQLINLVKDKQFMRENKTVIVQELINMRRDLRVILVGNEVVSHYWRINLAKEWKPTATSKGSRVDFDNFPEKWRQHIQDTFASLKLTTGAFDITWQNDDLDTLPLYLEVSPFYQPNPRMKACQKPYSNYKTGLQLKKSWDVAYVRLVFAIKEKQVAQYLKRPSFSKELSPAI